MHLTIKHCAVLHDIISQAIPEYAQYLDAAVWVNRKMRMYLSDKYTNDGLQAHRAYMLYTIADRYGNRMREVMSHIDDVYKNDVYKEIMQLCTLRLYVGEPLIPPATNASREVPQTGKLKDAIVKSRSTYKFKQRPISQYVVHTHTRTHTQC